MVPFLVIPQLNRTCPATGQPLLELSLPLVSTSHSPWLPCGSLSSFQSPSTPIKIQTLSPRYLSFCLSLHFLHPKQPLLQPPILPGPQGENVRIILDSSSKALEQFPQQFSPYLLANPFLHSPPKYVAPPPLSASSTAMKLHHCSHNLRTILLVRYPCASPFTNGPCCPGLNSLDM